MPYKGINFVLILPPLYKERLKQVKANKGLNREARNGLSNYSPRTAATGFPALVQHTGDFASHFASWSSDVRRSWRLGDDTIMC